MFKSNPNEITFLGDVFLPDVVKANLPYSNIVINLEAPITKSEKGVKGKITLRTPSNFLLDVFGKELVAACLANNHIGDYGYDGLSDSVKELKAIGIGCFGAGHNLEEAMAPFYIEIASKKIALLGFVCESTNPVIATNERSGIALIRAESVKTAIKLARKAGADLIVVSYHWGAEHVPVPSAKDVNIARRTIDDGADLIIGHHSHCVQTHEVYKKKYIFYGIGNGIFPDFEVSSSTAATEAASKAKPFRMKQEYWNRKSLAVRFDVVSGAVIVDKLRFTDDKLTVRNVDARLIRMPHGTGRSYSAFFHVAFCFGKFRRILMKFIRAPRVPRLLHLRNILKLVGTREYR